MRQSSRVKVLEGNGMPTTWQRSHRLMCQPGQSMEAARAAYGEDKIEKGDLVVVRTIIACPPRETREPVQ